MYVRELYQDIFKSGGIEVVPAADGHEALMLAREHPNLIFLDIMLPYINGLEVLERLKKDPETKDIPVILLTNLGQAEIVKKAYDLGAQGYIMKVRLKPKQLLEIAQKLLIDPNFKMDYSQLNTD